MKSWEPFIEVFSLVSTVATGVIDEILSRLCGRPSLVERQQLYEQHQETLRDSLAKSDEMFRRLRESRDRMEAKHERNLERYRKAKTRVDKGRLELADSNLPPDEVHRRLLVMESTLKSLEDRLEIDAGRIAEARRRERHATRRLSRVNSKWERFIERERADLEKERSVFGVLRRIWRVVSFALVYLLVTGRISGRGNTKD